MNLFSQIRSLVLEKIEPLVDSGVVSKELDLSPITVERPKMEAHGELATNAAIVVARNSNRNPREIALALKTRLETDPRISAINIAGPGFLNLTLGSDVWMESVRQALLRGSEFGRPSIGSDKTLLLEFVSANPTGPLHVGHARGAIFGDSLGRLFEYAGYKVVREYYVNDGGAQVDALARSAYLRYLEANGVAVEFQENSYQGGYLIPVGSALKSKFGKSLIEVPESVWLDQVRDFAIDEMLSLIRDDLDALGVKMDFYFSEKSLYGSGRIEDAIKTLRGKGLIYEGVLEIPKGKIPEDWEPRTQTLFRSTAFGDDVDRPILKSDGTWTYFAPDIAYHYDKILRNYDSLINVFGADHSGYIKRIKAAVSALSDSPLPFEIKVAQLVRVISEGGPAKMSKRSGQFVLLREAVEAVGSDAMRYAMLARKNDARLDFDFKKVQEQSRDNPVFYVQYAHARICSVLRKAGSAGIDVSDRILASEGLAGLDHPAQLAVARRIAEWPRVVDLALRLHEPHRIANFLYELSSDFHSLWAQGNSDGELRFLRGGSLAADRPAVALAASTGIVISTGLGILGVDPISEM